MVIINKFVASYLILFLVLTKTHLFVTAFSILTVCLVIFKDFNLCGLKKLG